MWLIDWANQSNNDFAIAEEVTVEGENTKRPDLVLYVNGIALGVLELKRSTVAVTEGIRQNLDSQKKEFIRPFYSTVQFVMAGNETEGLRYGVIETPEKYWLRWKEAEAHPDAGDNPLLRELSQLLQQGSPAGDSCTTSWSSMRVLRRYAVTTSTSGCGQRKNGCSAEKGASSGTPRAAERA